MALGRFLFGALLVALSGAANAQSETQPQTGGRSGMSTSMRAENVNAFRELSAFGTCIARFRRTTALALIASEADSREEAELFRRFIYGEQANCILPGTMQAPTIYFRGAIAEGLLRAGGVPASHMVSAPTVEQVRDLHHVARCYVAGHREPVRALLATRLGSPEETAAVAALWNDFRACMPANFNVRLNAPWIRFLLAEALLRLAPETTLAGN